MLKYAKHIFICINKRDGANTNNRSCGDEGILIRNEFIKQLAKLNLNINIKVNKSGCLGECKLGPTLVVYPKGEWYTKVSLGDIPKIIEKSIIN